MPQMLPRRRHPAAVPDFFRLAACRCRLGPFRLQSPSSLYYVDRLSIKATRFFADTFGIYKRLEFKAQCLRVFSLLSCSERFQLLLFFCIRPYIFPPYKILFCSRDPSSLLQRSLLYSSLSFAGSPRSLIVRTSFEILVGPLDRLPPPVRRHLYFMSSLPGATG